MHLNREQAWQLLQRYVTGVSLLKHCMAVEIAMKAYAGKFGGDPEYWGMVGLLHDIDFEQYPDDHPHHAREILLSQGFNDEFIVNVESHARDWPETRTAIQKTLLAVDELTGFVIACALVRPDKSLDHLEVKSVLKKFKDKAFARAVNRETIKNSTAAMDVELRDHIGFVIAALAQAAHDPAYQQLPLVG